MEAFLKRDGVVLRCRPGDMARVIHSIYPPLIGRVVLVDSWGQDGRWNVRLVGAPSFGISRSKRPVIAHECAFRDSSLEPIRHSDPALTDSPISLQVSAYLDFLASCSVASPRQPASHQ